MADAIHPVFSSSTTALRGALRGALLLTWMSALVILRPPPDYTLEVNDYELGRISHPLRGDGGLPALSPDRPLSVVLRPARADPQMQVVGYLVRRGRATPWPLRPAGSDGAFAWQGTAAQLLSSAPGPVRLVLYVGRPADLPAPVETLSAHLAPASRHLRRLERSLWLARPGWQAQSIMLGCAGRW